MLFTDPRLTFLDALAELGAGGLVALTVLLITTGAAMVAV